MGTKDENRKELISFKISTLVIFVFAMICISVLIVIIASNFSNNDEATTNQNNINEKQVTNAETTEEPVRTIKSQVSSRSGESRIEEQIQEKTPSIPIEQVTISKDMDLTVRTGLSKEDFITLISKVEQDKTNFFEENAGFIYDMCEKYSLNEIFFCGLISAECGWDISSSHRNANNFISLMSHKGLIKYPTVEEGLEKAAQTLHDNYLFPGGKFYNGATLEGMKKKFCPASKTWVNLVYKMMGQIME